MVISARSRIDGVPGGRFVLFEAKKSKTCFSSAGSSMPAGLLLIRLPITLKEGADTGGFAMKPILLIQGANMEYLGKREPEFYGTTSADELDAILHAASPGHGMVLDIRYTNMEGEAISWIYEADRGDVAGLIMNPAGFLYAGYALRDCLRAVSLPYIEVHMTNIDRRERRSVTASEADGMITGLGVNAYVLALSAMEMLQNPSAEG